MRALALSAGLLLMSACAASPAGAPLPPLPPVPPQTPATAAASAPPAQPSPAGRSPSDRCGASDLQYLVGRPRTEIPVPVTPGNRRVLCTTCPMTRDYRVDRQTILFEADSDLITSVACN